MNTIHAHAIGGAAKALRISCAAALVPTRLLTEGASNHRTPNP